MNRREALKAATVLVGGVLVTSTCVPTARAPEPRKAAPGVLTLEDQELIEDIADTLLPPTPASPGAKAAGAGAEINLLLTDCYEPEVQRRVLRGLQEFRAICRARRGAAFTSLAPPERERLLREIDAEAEEAGEAHWFGIIRELALRAYFSSEIGMTRALRYVLIPGRWEGCIPLAPGQPAWG